jgi:hypothetical protein
MLTGVVPFEGDSVPGVLKRVQQATFEPPSRRRLDLPSELDAWFERAIQPDRARRFASVEEMSRAFRQIARAHSSSLFEELPNDITQETVLWSTPPEIASDPTAHSLLARALHAPWYRKIVWGMAGLLALALVSLAIMRARGGRENLVRRPAARPATFTPPAVLAESAVQLRPAHSMDEASNGSTVSVGDSRAASVAGDSRAASVAGDSRAASVAGDSRAATTRKPRGPRKTSGAKPVAGGAAATGDAHAHAPSVAPAQPKDRGF